MKDLVDDGPSEPLFTPSVMPEAEPVRQRQRRRLMRSHNSQRRRLMRSRIHRRPNRRSRSSSSQHHSRRKA